MVAYGVSQTKVDTMVAHTMGHVSVAGDVA